MPMTNRREFLKRTPALISLLVGVPALAHQKRSKSLVLRSSWQTVNIGDIGHTPGVLRLLENIYQMLMYGSGHQVWIMVWNGSFVGKISEGVNH